MTCFSKLDKQEREMSLLISGSAQIQLNIYRIALGEPESSGDAPSQVTSRDITSRSCFSVRVHQNFIKETLESLLSAYLSSRLITAKIQLAP